MTIRPARLPVALIGWCLLQLALSAVFITAFTMHFGFGRRLIWLHLSVLGGSGALAALLLLHLVRRKPTSGAIRRLAAGAAAALATFLWLLYAANAVSNWLWRDSVTCDLAARYLARPRVLAGYMLLLVDWPVLVAGAALIIAGALAVVRSRRIDAGLAMVQALTRAESRALRGWLLAAAAIASISAAAAVLTVPSSLPRTLLLRREPLMGFFLPSVQPDRLGLASLANRYRIEGPAVRARYSPTGEFERRNVILIVADSLRSDHLSVYGYGRPTTPFLERLHASGRLRLVRHALATCPESSCGISSLLTSKTYASQVQENFKLHDLFHDRGYAVHFLLSGDHAWLGLRLFYGTGFTSYFDGHDSRRHDVTDDRLLLEGLERLPPFSGQPAFFYFHLMSSHVLGIREDRHLVYRPSRTRTTYAMFGRDSREMRVNNYDNGVRQTDAVIEQLFEALRARGYLENAIVVITSDHGEALGERGHDSFGHGWSLYEESLRIPLLIYDEVGAPYANLEFATQTDIAPTIVERVGLPIPSSWEGRSLLQAGVKPYSHHFLPHSSDSAVFHLREGRTYKLLRQDGREALFELRTDPDERRDLLASADPVLVADLRRRLDNALAERLGHVTDAVHR